jgi:hypothetical protein
MVTIVKFGKVLRSPFYYNENKVRAGIAEFIHSANYGKDTDQLTRQDRLTRLVRQAARNERATINSIHITVNFHPDEKITKETLQQIVDSYMRQIGLGGQPYLVYQHKDAVHPHVHIVTTPIQLDGIPIPAFIIVKWRSESARQAIEKEFGLVRARDHHLTQTNPIQPINAEKVQYGRMETMRAISNVLDAVLPKYKYTTLAELNTVLRDYNVMVDEGSKDSFLRRCGGLIYRVLDEQGKKVGTPIKASNFHNKPTLKFLQKQFARNEPFREPGKSRLRETIDFVFNKEPLRDLGGLRQALQRHGIQLVMRPNDQGKVNDLSYIDHKSGVILKADDLGKEYSAARISERIDRQDIPGLIQKKRKRLHL